MQFTNEEWLAFAQKLEQATEAGRLSWQTADPDWIPGAYRATVPGNAIYVLSSRDNDGEFPFVLEIADLDGTKLDSFTTIPYGDGWESSDDKDASAVLDRLYGRVGRLVTGAPQKAQSLLAGLDGLIPVNRPSNESPF